MLTIIYKNYLPQIETWRQQLETLVMAHQIVQDENCEAVILKNTNETVIGEADISKYMDELMEFQKVWFACACR